MNGVLRAELLATRKRPGVWVVGGAWVVLAVAFGSVVPAVVYLAVRHRPAGSSQDPGELLAGLLPDRFLSGTVSLYPMFGSALMLILGAVVLGGEYRWGTWGTLFVQRPGRSAAVLAKAAAVAVTALAVTVLVVAVSAAASGIAAAAAGRPAPWPGAAALLAGTGAAWLVSMAAASLGMFLAVLLRSTGAATAVGLLWLLAVENLVSGLAGALPALKGVQRVLIGPNAGSLATGLAPAGAPAPSVPGLVSVSGPGVATAVLVTYVVVFLTLSAVVVERRDLS